MTRLTTFAWLLSAAIASGITPAAPQAPATPQWLSFTDTAEGAFTMDVPLGWQVQGGMYRFGYFDVRWMMDVRSLDGKIVLRIDDVNIPPYTLPGPHTGREGQPYFKPQQFQMMVSAYRDGAHYAQTYASKRFSSVCPALTPRAADWRPTMPPAWQIQNGRSTEGSLAYSCTSADGPREASIFVRTTLFPQSGLWVADPVISIIAAPESMPLGRSIAQHMIDSWRENPQWKQHQEQMTQMGLDQIRAGFQQFMQQMRAYDAARTQAMNRQVAGFEAHQNAQAQQVSSWGETLTGLTTVQDPQTGTRFQVFTGPKSNYYENGNGVKINSDISPGPEFHQLNEVPQ